jgi:hypothetical protein
MSPASPLPPVPLRSGTGFLWQARPVSNGGLGEAGRFGRVPIGGEIVFVNRLEFWIGLIGSGLSVVASWSPPPGWIRSQLPFPSKFPAAPAVCEAV